MGIYQQIYAAVGTMQQLYSADASSWCGVVRFR